MGRIYSFEQQDEIEMQDDYAVCSLIKGTAFRELGKLDAAHECLDNLRYGVLVIVNIYFHTILFLLF